MNAYCTYDDDSTYYDFAEPGYGSPDCDAPSSDSSDLHEEFGTGHIASSEALTLFGVGPDLDELEADFDDFDDDRYFEDADAVERHAMRSATLASTLDAMAEGVERGDVPGTPAAAALLTWSAPHLSAPLRRVLADVVHSAGSDDGGTTLALWRGGALERYELRHAAREFLDAARVQLAVETHEDARVIEGPWRRGLPPLERTYQLHLLYLAVRHAELELDEIDEQVAELWQEELRTELSARQRETRSAALDPQTGREHFAESVHLVAAAAEMWRDTAPAARPVRLPLEKLTRLLWQAARQRKVHRTERAALLIAAGNQRLDDLPTQSMEAGLYADDSGGGPRDRAVKLLTATWIDGRRPDFTPEPAPESRPLDLATEALVMRALSGPARTGPRRG